MRSFGNLLDSAIKLENKLNTKAWALRFVPRGGLVGIGTRKRLYAKAVQASRSFAKSSSRISAQSCPAEGLAR